MRIGLKGRTGGVCARFSTKKIFSKMFARTPTSVRDITFDMPFLEYINYEVIDDNRWELYDEENFERAAEMDLPEEDYGLLEIPEGRYILESVESDGQRWPFSCRDGICSNCAAVLISGKIEMDGDQALSDDEIQEKNIRLTCVGRPASDYIRLIYNAKQLDYLQDRIM